MVVNSNVNEAVREWLSLYPSGLELISIYLSFHKPIINVKSLIEGYSSCRIGSTKNTEVCQVRVPWPSRGVQAMLCVLPTHSPVPQWCSTLSAPWTVAPQATLSLEFSRQKCWCGSPVSSPGDLPDSGIKPTSPAPAGRFFTTEPPGSPVQGRG